MHRKRKGENWEEDSEKEEEKKGKKEEWEEDKRRGTHQR